MDRTPKVAVVGAGLAGLGAAWRLSRAGCDVALFEREPRPGGRATSETIDGYTLEPVASTVSTADRALLEWIAEVGLHDELLPLRPVIAAVAHRDRVVEIDPRSLPGIARIPGVRRIQALRLLRLSRLIARFGDRLDPERPARAADLDDRSLADFGELYFGASVVDRWMAPLAFGASSADARESSRALFLLRYVTHGGSRVGLPRGSFGELAETAASKLATYTDLEVERLERRRGTGLRMLVRGGRTLDVDAAVVATSAPDAARIADPLLSSAERDGFARVRYAPSVTLAAALRRPFAAHPLEVRYPRSEGSALAMALLEPGVSGGRVPDAHGLVLLRATAKWGRAHLEAPDDAVAKHLVEAFERVHPGFRNAVLFQRVLRAARGFPCFDVGRYREIARFEGVQVDRRLRGRRLYFAGDYLMDPSWNGALLSGYRAAEAVRADLTGEAADAASR
jgi:oxygen-dependent protoporphyrinogen oxidase